MSSHWSVCLNSSTSPLKCDTTLNGQNLAMSKHVPHYHCCILPCPKEAKIGRVEHSKRGCPISDSENLSHLSLKDSNCLHNFPRPPGRSCPSRQATSKSLRTFGQDEEKKNFSGNNSLPKKNTRGKGQLAKNNQKNESFHKASFWKNERKIYPSPL